MRQLVIANNYRPTNYKELWDECGWTVDDFHKRAGTVFDMPPSSVPKKSWWQRFSLRESDK